MIVRNCNLGLLAEMMGRGATDDDAVLMRDALLARNINDTDDVTDGEWLTILVTALAGA